MVGHLREVPDAHGSLPLAVLIDESRKALDEPLGLLPVREVAGLWNNLEPSSRYRVPPALPISRRHDAVPRTEPTSRVERARIILAYLEDPSAYAVGRTIGVTQQTVTRCLERAAELGVIEALDDRPRAGRDRVITAEAKTWLVALACRKAKELGYPHELWTTRLLAAHARQHGPSAGHPSLAKLAQGTVCKILAEQEVKPHNLQAGAFGAPPHPCCFQTRTQGTPTGLHQRYQSRASRPHLALQNRRRCMIPIGTLFWKHRTRALGVPSGDAMFEKCVVVSASPPMSARSGLSSGSCGSAHSKHLAEREGGAGH